MCAKRTDMPNRTISQLTREGWIFLDGKYTYLVQGILDTVRNELDRMYWNANQKEMVSPFANSGAANFVTDYVTIRSYNWNENVLPNFDTDNLKVFWYKHSHRGVSVLVKENNTDLADVLAEVVNQAVNSIAEYFKED